MSFTRSSGTPPPWYGVNPIQTGLTNNYAAQPYDYYIGVSGPNVTVTLPLGSSVIQGKTYVIKDEGGNRVTITTSGGNLIDTTTTLTTTQNYTAVTVFWTGTKWSII